MRLINVNTGKLEIFNEGEIPEYAILSHRWTQDEVTMEEFSAVKVQKGLARLNKIQNCCRQAARDSLGYVWVDTCCIDKSNSQELSEAINSMYRWYRNAKVCYSFLEDVLVIDKWSQSQWFTRGWTLQELIAPKDIHFFNKEWRFIGSKTDLSSSLAERTGIPVRALLDFHPEQYPVAQKMSWASKRTTTRVEDRAYSLLGIFAVNMPLNYGEGEEAFLTLQRRIIESYNDQTILAWSGTPNRKFPFLAASPTEFQHSHCIVFPVDEVGQFPSHFSPSVPDGSRSVLESSIDDRTGLVRQGQPINYQEQYEILGLHDDGFHMSNAGLSVTFFLVPLFPDVYVAILHRCEVIASSVNSGSNIPCLCMHVEDNVVAKGTFVSRRKKTCSECLNGNSLPTRYLNVGIFLHYSRMARLYTRIALDGQHWAVYGSDRLVKMGTLQRIVVSRWQLALKMSRDRSYKVDIGPIPKWWYDHLSRAFIDNEDDDSRCVEAIEKRMVIYRREHFVEESMSYFEMPFGEVGVAAIISFTSRNLATILVHLGFDENFAAFCLISQISLGGTDIHGDRTNMFDCYIRSKYCKDDCEAADSDDILYLVKCLRHQQDNARVITDKVEDSKLFMLGRQNRSKTVHFADSELTLTTTEYGFDFSVGREPSRAGWRTMYQPLDRDSSHPTFVWRIIAAN